MLPNPEPYGNEQEVERLISRTKPVPLRMHRPPILISQPLISPTPEVLPTNTYVYYPRRLHISRELEEPM